MNMECHGIWMPGAKLYRCAYDGKLLALDQKPKKCPHCNRVAVAHTARSQPRWKTESVTSISIPGIGGWQEVTRTTDFEWRHGKP